MNRLTISFLVFLPLVASQRFSNGDDSLEDVTFRQQFQSQTDDSRESNLRFLSVIDSRESQESQPQNNRGPTSFSSDSDERGEFFSTFPNSNRPSSIFRQRNERPSDSSNRPISFSNIQSGQRPRDRDSFEFSSISNGYSVPSFNNDRVYVPPTLPRYVPPTLPRYVRPCNQGEYRAVDGKCAFPEIIQNIYIYGEPESEEDNTNYNYQAPRPKIKHNLIIIKSNDDKNSDDDPIVIPPALQKTIVLVLDKEEEKGPKKTIYVPEQPEIEPEVFFVDYKEGDNPLLPGGIDLQTALRATNTGKRFSDTEPTVPQFESNKKFPSVQQYSTPGNPEISPSYLPSQQRQHSSEEQLTTLSISSGNNRNILPAGKIVQNYLHQRVKSHSDEDSREGGNDNRIKKRPQFPPQNRNSRTSRQKLTNY